MHAVRELTHRVGNYGSRRVREDPLPTLAPHRGVSNVLVRSYERMSDTFGTHLVLWTQSTKLMFVFGKFKVNFPVTYIRAHNLRLLVH